MAVTINSKSNANSYDIIREDGFEACCETAPFCKTKRAWRLNLPVRGTGIPTHNKQAHAPGREHYAYPLVCLKITSFRTEIQSECFYFFTLRSFANIIQC